MRMTWGPVVDTDIPNPGSAAEVMRLQSGHWALVYNDTEQERFSLAVSISDDEGATWRWTRHLERAEPSPDAPTASYPSVIQGRDGSLHVSYTYILHGKHAGPDYEGKLRHQCIKHARFNEEWVMQAGRAQ